jgi:hypothetical protein
MRSKARDGGELGFVIDKKQRAARRGRTRSGALLKSWVEKGSLDLDFYLFQCALSLRRSGSEPIAIAIDHDPGNVAHDIMEATKHGLSPFAHGERTHDAATPRERRSGRSGQREGRHGRRVRSDT